MGIGYIPAKNTTTGHGQIAVVESDQSFDTVVTHNYADNTTWPATDDSLYTVGPSSGKVMHIRRAEVQFSHDVTVSGVTDLYFDVWVYNPADLPNKMLYQRITYSSILNVLERGNAHYTLDASVTAPLDGITQPLHTVQFNYPSAIALNDSTGAEVRVHTNGDTPMGGTYCTISFIVTELDE